MIRNINNTEKSNKEMHIRKKDAGQSIKLKHQVISDNDLILQNNFFKEKSLVFISKNLSIFDTLLDYIGIEKQEVMNNRQLLLSYLYKVNSEMRNKLMELLHSHNKQMGFENKNTNLKEIIKNNILFVIKQEREQETKEQNLSYFSENKDLFFINLFSKRLYFISSTLYYEKDKFSYKMIFDKKKHLIAFDLHFSKLGRILFSIAKEQGKFIFRITSFNKISYVYLKRKRIFILNRLKKELNGFINISILLNKSENKKDIPAFEKNGMDILA